MSQTESTSTPTSASIQRLDSFQTEDEYEQLKRFQIELEFVQCLANPWYLHHLAQQQYFNQDTFVRYLDYLQYFRKPEYAKYIIYPHCLHFLTLLQHKSFRDHLAKQDTATFVHERQYYHWQYLRNQDRVVRIEIMPDGSLVEIKNEIASSSQPSTAQGQTHGDVAVGPTNGSVTAQQAQGAAVLGTVTSNT
ncbi:SOH1-domain-containing protein [Gamsiella multidivaricata]|uniref:SOH1-domain-containing protein n=1 Tax=Gamsiella multidivaricata TaxID=101098 RepID=UPI00221F4F6A|nr:SOH1-domain-containing protein [Gamsiella multidivaricata]KAI7830217.1 SOH1-domain-containing protein [Gamsiella multidivaricata]